ncbi:MAG: apolipoprotein N-acyltransferase [Deltaproteobacteria bacterium]|nr:apolipoprotein N-acyltransferase [Deltaproteobacteria bacterium]
MSSTLSTAVAGSQPRPLPPWPLLGLLSGVLVGVSQPIVIESLGGKQPLDGTGLSGLLALVGLVPALVALEGQGPRRAYALGIVTWMTACCLIVQWIVTTVHVYAGAPLYAALAVLGVMAGAMAAYAAAAFAVARVIARFFAWPTWWTLPPAVAAVELLRNYGPVGGFGWGTLGHSFATVPVFLQAAALVGVSGMTFFAALVNAALADVMHSWWTRRELRLRPLAVAVVVVAVWAGFGVVRLRQDVTSGPSVRVALLQPNVNEGLADLVRESEESVLERFHAQEREALARGADVIIWPEGSFPNRKLRRDIKSMADTKLLPDDVTPPPASIVGAAVIGREKDDDGKARWVRHNAALVVDDELAVLGRFDKTHLVPFGEYVPWPFGAVIRQFIPLGTTTPGTTLKPIAVDVKGHRLNVGITICYEGVFPEISRALARAGANFFANLTDDRWYGVSGMATQHLNMYAIRAVESGRPVARSTNTGISAWIDVHGGIHGRTAMYEAALLVGDVPLRTIDTVYLATGDVVALLSLAFTLLAWFTAMLGGRDVLARRRPTVTLLLGGLGLLSVVAGLALWLGGNGLDEARSTQAQLLTVGGLLVGLGALSQRRWGKLAVQIVSVLVVVFGAVAVIVGGPAFVGFVLLGAGLFILGRRHHASVPPPVFPAA